MQPQHEAFLDQARLPQTFLNAFQAAGDDRAQLWNIVKQYFDTRPVESGADIRPNAYYFFVGKQTAIIRTSSRTTTTSEVRLRHAFTEQALKSKSREEFLNLGKRGALYLLFRRPVPTTQLPAAATESQHAAESASAAADEAATKGRREAAVTRAFFQTLIGDIERTGRILADFGRLHGVQVPFNIDTSTITMADRGAFRTGLDDKARAQLEIIQSHVGAAVSTARGVIQRREHEFNRTKMNITGSQRQKMLHSFTPAKQALQTVERAVQRLIQGLDIALHLGEEGEEGTPDD